MNQKEFVLALKIVACDKASMGVLNTIRNPPEKSPDASLVKLSNWFNRLVLDEKVMVEEIVNLATKQAVYNVLLVLDGLLSVSPKGQLVEFELLARDSVGCETLNDPEKEALTDLFAGG
jgi:hypothetical protein